MQTLRTHRNSLIASAAVTLMLLAVPARAHAESKEMIQLQTEVQQLLDMVQRLQSTMDTRFAVLQNLAQQTADQATQMSSTVNALQKALNTQNDALSGKLDTSSGQVQSLNDSVDELKTRIAKLDKSVQDLQAQIQTLQTPPPTPTAAPQGGNGAGQIGVPGPGGNAGAAPLPSTPPLEQTYQAALADFNAAKYPLSTSEFQDVIHYYPLDPIAGSAQFYLGEIAYRQKNYDDAITAYNAVLEQFSGSPKAAAAQLHKGMALIETGKRDAGIHELRSLIERHPQAPEASTARSKLNAMGVRISPR
ncbi:MAG TPA: tetratricopeptide repeat protein [Terracidiphilus sp.]|jgi:tol-pal system protein YbgF|nr:tetratricopeptide repeat protein [Terracidiphilus sp.]